MSIFDVFIGSRRASAFFVTRAKRGLDYTRRSRRRVDKTTGLRSDQTIVLAGPKTSRLYPDPLRRVSFYDAENDRRFVFLTNNFTLPALTIAKLYKCRWQVELFFKWIKQNLHIKSFYGTQRQRGEDSSVDRDQRLRARRHRQEGTRAGAEPQRNLANSQPDAFRENPYFSGIERAKIARSGTAFP